MTEGHECCVAYGRHLENCEDIPSYYIGSRLGVYANALKARFFDNEGRNAKAATRKLLKYLDEYNPDVIWIHNLHGYYVNYEILFAWIKSRDVQVKWTLHDCWAFTGHCAYFSAIGCDAWRTVCDNCPQRDKYPKAYASRAKSNHEAKKRAFSGVTDLEIFTPSEWMADLVRKSFLGSYRVSVRENQIDTSIFQRQESDFREKYNLENKKIVLGVASVWEERKGLKTFLQLADMLGEDYKVVLVGLNPSQTEDAIKHTNVLPIPRTSSPIELAKIYSAADVFVNPSLEETFGLTTAEAASCGAKVIVYKNTACEEVAKKYGGISVETGAENILKAIKEQL